MPKTKRVTACLKCGKEITIDDMTTFCKTQGVDVCRRCYTKVRSDRMRKSRKAKDMQYEEKLAFEEKQEAILLIMDDYDNTPMLDEWARPKALALRKRRAEMLFQRELQQIDENLDL